MNPTITIDGPMIATLNSGDNTYGSGANGISILQDVLTTSNGITLNSVGISYDSGTTITTTTWDDISTRVAQLSAIAPNGLNATILAVNNTVFIENADTAPTRVISISTDTPDFGIEWEGDGLPFVMETLDATPLEVKDTTFQLNDSITPLLTTMTASTLTSGASSKTWADIIAGAGSVGTLNSVLTNGNTATGTHATITLTDSDVGGQANPILILNNTNATGSVGLEVYKNKPTAGVAGDVLFNQSVYGKDSFLNKQEYTRITHTLRDGTGGVEDGSIEFGCFVNGSFNNFLQINGNENEVNCLKSLDMGGNTIATRLNDMTIATTASTGTGNLTITAKGNLTETGNSVAITSVGSAGDAITLTSAGNINLIPNATTGAIRTDSNITTLTTAGGCKIDFAGGNPDTLFDINKEKVRLHWNDAVSETATILLDNQYDTTSNITMSFTTATGDVTTKIDNIATSQSVYLNDTRTGNVKSIKLDNNTSSSENRMDLIQNSGGGIVAQSVIVNTAGTQMLSLSHTDNSINKALSLRQDTGGTGKLQYDNTIDSSAFEILSNQTPLTLTAIGEITLNPTTSVVLNTQIQMPTTSGTISYNAITGSLDIDFASQSTGYFELSNLSPVSISSFTLTNGRIGGEYHILLRGPSGFSYTPTPSATFKANNYSITTTNGDEWVGLKIYLTNTLTQYLVNATLYT